MLLNSMCVGDFITNHFGVFISHQVIPSELLEEKKSMSLNLTGSTIGLNSNQIS